MFLQVALLREDTGLTDGVGVLWVFPLLLIVVTMLGCFFVPFWKRTRTDVTPCEEEVGDALKALEVSVRPALAWRTAVQALVDQTFLARATRDRAGPVPARLKVLRVKPNPRRDTQAQREAVLFPGNSWNRGLRQFRIFGRSGASVFVSSDHRMKMFCKVTLYLSASL